MLMTVRIIVAICTAVLPLCAGTATAQNITGTVLDNEKGGSPVRGVVVTMLDAVNADELATATTDFDGRYDSGLIPAGHYRLRFGHQFHMGDDGASAFCSADVIAVQPLTTTVVDHRFTVDKDPPKEIVNDPKGGVTGTVRDAVTLTSLHGIQVIILDATSAEPLATVTTGPDGTYEFSGAAHQVARVRFRDPSGTYFPQFHGAGGADVYCSGTPVGLDDESYTDAFMNRVPPEVLTDQLVDALDSLDLPASVDAMLTTPVTRLIDLLSDGNGSNDMAGCGQLTAFVSRVDVQGKKGQLSPSEAAALRQAADNVAISLGCHR
jgi:5-hydroxyisourate hydrolase-like protein (transthyretin family)